MADDQLRIRLLAYRIWEAEDCPEGQAERHWNMACRLVAAERITDVPQDAQPKPAARGTKASEPDGAEAFRPEADATTEPAVKKATAKRSTTAKRRSTEGAESRVAAPKKAAAKTSTPRKAPATRKKDADATATTPKRSKGSKSSDDNPSQ